MTRFLAVQAGRFAFLGWAAWATAAFPHHAPAGWPYATDCCSGMDCAQIDLPHVKATATGWLVTLEPADHPMVKPGFTALVPYGDPRVRISGDDFFHACIGPTRQHLFCLYVPPGGV